MVLRRCGLQCPRLHRVACKYRLCLPLCPFCTWHFPPPSVLVLFVVLWYNDRLSRACAFFISWPPSVQVSDVKQAQSTLKGTFARCPPRLYPLSFELRPFPVQTAKVATATQAVDDRAGASSVATKEQTVQNCIEGKVPSS